MDGLATEDAHLHQMVCDEVIVHSVTIIRGIIGIFIQGQTPAILRWTVVTTCRWSQVSQTAHIVMGAADHMEICVVERMRKRIALWIYYFNFIFNKEIEYDQKRNGSMETAIKKSSVN